MGEFAPRRGEWEILDDESRRDGISGRRRASAVTFSPSASRSRLHFLESGLRYEVRLTRAGRVQIRSGSSSWQDIDPGRDPLTGVGLPPAVTHHRHRLGRRIFRLPPFDMIAVGRGRIFARAAGTDRFFHLKLDELFRTTLVHDGDGDTMTFLRADPPVPSTFITLDAEFYEEGNDAAGAPPLLAFDYDRHPASLRFGLFAKAMTAGAASSDFTIVPMRPRVWYELESRPPLKVFDFDDLLGITIGDLRTVLRDNPALLRQVVKRAITNHPKLKPVLMSALASDAVLLQALGGLVDLLLKAVAFAISEPARQEALAAQPRLDGLVQLGALGAALQIARLNEPRDFGGRTPVRPLEFSDTFLETTIRPELLMQVLDEGRNPHLERFIEKVVATARARRGRTIPNTPPPNLPRYTHVRYREIATHRVAERHSIDFIQVLDLGVGYSHWHEHWHVGYGGEIHSLLARRPIAQQEGFNSILYRFLNGPVLDGDGYNDGTTNFYILVRLRGNARRFAILWIDEQTYFSQRWRLVHPTADTNGDLFSLARTIRDHPEYFRFDIAQYWDPFEHEGFISATSRMAVSRQTLAVTGRDPTLGRREIYTFTFNYGVSDHTWRWRRMPAGRSFPGTLGLREDLTLHLRGFQTLPGSVKRVVGRFFQRVLPANLNPVPRSLDLTSGKPAAGYTHDWHFFSEAAWARADRFLVMGAYERRVSARCQYYSIEILPDRDGKVVDIGLLTGNIWRNEPNAGIPPLAHDTENFTWKVGGSAIKLGDLLERRAERDSMSMYENVTRFRLLDRGRRGLIAVYFDPRDDELQPASHLPQRVPLSRDDRVPEEDPFIVRLPDIRPGPPRPPRVRFNPVPIGIGVTFKSHARVLRPPIVRKMRVARTIVEGLTESVLLSFWTPLGDEEVTENLWQLTIGALPANGDTTIIFRSLCFGPFTRVAAPARPIAFDATAAEELADERRFDFRWNALTDTQRRNVDRFCTPRGRMLYATSVWFEDIVGHLATSESLEFTTE
jgi:hypothetical protein